MVWLSHKNQFVSKFQPSIWKAVELHSPTLHELWSSRFRAVILVVCVCACARELAHCRPGRVIQSGIIRIYIRDWKRPWNTDSLRNFSPQWSFATGAFEHAWRKICNLSSLFVLSVLLLSFGGLFCLFVKYYLLQNCAYTVFKCSGVFFPYQKVRGH